MSSGLLYWVKSFLTDHPQRACVPRTICASRRAVDYVSELWCRSSSCWMKNKFMSFKLSSSETWKLLIILNIWEHTYISIQISQTILILYARNSEAGLNFSVCQPRDRETESPCFNMSACYGHFTPVNKNKPTKAVNDLCSSSQISADNFH